MGATVNSSIAVGGTAQPAIAANDKRTSILIQAIDEEMWCSFHGTAAVNAGFLLLKGQSRVMTQDVWSFIRNALSVRCATTGSRYVIQDDAD